MGLHDFLARSLDLLTLLAHLDQRQTAIAADLAEIAASSVDDPGRGSVLARLEAEQHEASSELDRALALLAGFDLVRNFRLTGGERQVFSGSTQVSRTRFMQEPF